MSGRRLPRTFAVIFLFLLIFTQVIIQVQGSNAIEGVLHEDVVLHIDNADVTAGSDIGFSHMGLESHRILFGSTYWGIYPVAGSIDIILYEVSTSDMQINFTSDGTNTVYNWTRPTDYPFVAELSGSLTSVVIKEYSPFRGRLVFHLNGSDTVTAKVDCSAKGIPKYVTSDGVNTSFAYDAVTKIANFSVSLSGANVVVYWGTFSITNMEGCGDWVFVGRTQYDFYGIYETNYTGTVVSAGFSFLDDAGDNHTVWYDNSTKLTTITSPRDGISASTTNVTIVGNATCIHWSVMFNPTIPDTLNTILWTRMTAGTNDTGWDNAGVTFSIYNLGGFSTLTSSGWAGRTPGGDVFEIYAADTRTKNLVPLENFDVRETPLGVGWQIGGVWIVDPEDESGLIDELTGWDVHLPAREVNHTIYPTNRLPEGAPETATSYYSYPFGLRIYDYPRSHSRYMFADRSFIRPITADTGELVTVQVFAMTPKTNGTTGRIIISDIGLYPYYAEGGAVRDSAANFGFAGNGKMRASDGGGWADIDTYVGWQWYNITFVLNITAQTYDIYVDDVLKADDFGFDDPDVGSLGVLTLAHNLWAPIGNYTDIYFDDVRVWTDFDGNYGGDAKATATFLYLQHWSMDWGFGVEEGREYVQGPTHSPSDPTDDYSNHGFIELGWDVCIDDIWENNLLVARINITDGDVDVHKNCWVEYNVTWYQNGTYIKHDILYGLFEGYKFAGAPGAKDVTGWYWDMWFNRMNASTVIGGRLNTKYFGMSEKSIGFIYWGTNWKPMDDITHSTCFVDLLDSSDNIHSVKEVALVRPWVRVFRTNQSTFHYAIQDIDASEFRTTSETMRGIDTPPIKETVSVKAVTGGIGVFLASAFKGIIGGLGERIVMGTVTMWTYFVGFMDVLFSFFGFPGFISTALDIANSFFDFMTTLIVGGYLINLITNIFTFITSTFGHIILWLTRILTTFTNIFTIVWGIIDGTYTGLGTLQDFWAVFNWDAWSDALPIFAIISWFISIDNRSLQAGGGWIGFFLGDLQTFFNLLSFFTTLMMRIIELVTGMIFRVINSIPGI